MLLRSAVAPPYERLRPAVSKIRTDAFPVYPDLRDRLLAPLVADPLADRAVPHALGTCSAYAYSDAETVSMIMARLGLEDNRCLEICQEVDALLISTTAYLVQSADGSVVVLVFRGTSPLHAIDWLGDLDVVPERLRVHLGAGGSEHDVHAGFYRNVRSVRYAIIEALCAALAGRSILPGPAREGDERLGPMQALHITGHSLGAALAALTAVLLKADPAPDRVRIADTLRTVHTFGQPMIGSASFAEAAARLRWDDTATLGDRLVRWICGQDIVPCLPPSLSGGFAHFGREYRSAGRGWERSAAPVTQLRGFGLATAGLGLALQPIAVLRDRIPGPSITDHLPARYLDRLAPPGVNSEFGD